MPRRIMANYSCPVPGTSTEPYVGGAAESPQGRRVFLHIAGRREPPLNGTDRLTIIRIGVISFMGYDPALVYGPLAVTQRGAGRPARRVEPNWFARFPSCHFLTPQDRF